MLSIWNYAVQHGSRSPQSRSPALRAARGRRLRAGRRARALRRGARAVSRPEWSALEGAFRRLRGRPDGGATRAPPRSGAPKRSARGGRAGGRRAAPVRGESRSSTLAARRADSARRGSARKPVGRGGKVGGPARCPTRAGRAGRDAELHSRAGAAASTAPAHNQETTMKTGRIDFYTKVHKGLRAGLFRLSERAAATDYSDSQALAALA